MDYERRRAQNRFSDCQLVETGLGGGVTLWAASTDDAVRLPDIVECLSEDECAQADRLRRSVDRERFVAARVLLRHALSQAAHWQISPVEWRYREGLNGKPVVADGLPQFEFNVSHSSGYVAAGVSTSGPIGVDIESVIKEDGLEIVYDALTGRECAYLREFPVDQQWAIFIRFWTIKEACAKALSLGTALDFCRLEIELDPPHVAFSADLMVEREEIHVATSIVGRGQQPYCLSAARLTTYTTLKERGLAIAS